MLVKSNASEKALSQTLPSTSITETTCNKVYVNKPIKQMLCLYRVFRNATCGQLDSAFCVLFLVQPCKVRLLFIVYCANSTGEKVGCVLIKPFQTVGKQKKETVKAHLIVVRMASVSNYRYPITKSWNWIHVIGHPRDRTPVKWQVNAKSAYHEREFCYRCNWYCCFFSVWTS